MKFLMGGLVLTLLLLCAQSVCAALFWQGLKTARTHGYDGGHYQRALQPHHTGWRRAAGSRTGRTYSDIARVVNPNPYAFVGSRNPYPGQPFYPQG